MKLVLFYLLTGAANFLIHYVKMANDLELTPATILEWVLLWPTYLTKDIEK